MEVSLSRSLVVDACELVFFSHPPRRDLRGSFPQFSLVGARSHRGCSPANLPVPLVVPWGAQLMSAPSAKDASHLKMRVVECAGDRENILRSRARLGTIFSTAVPMNCMEASLHRRYRTSYPPRTCTLALPTPWNLGQSGGAHAGRPPLLPSFWRDTLRRRRRVAPFATAMAIAAPGPERVP